MPRRSVLSTVDYENLLAVPTSKEEMLRYYTPSGRALAGMLAVFAQFEREILSDRLRLGSRRPGLKVDHTAGLQRRKTRRLRFGVFPRLD